jgi:predicted transcriptional regulator
MQFMNEEKQSWTFLSNYSHVLICLSRDPHLTMREVASQVGITERAVQRIVRELIESGVLEAEKQGRRNVYRVNADTPLRHPLESHSTVGDLLQAVQA